MVALAILALAPAGPAPRVPVGAPDALAFVRNDGQWNSRALYKGRAPGVDLWVTDDGLTLDFYRIDGIKKHDRSHAKRVGNVVRLKIEGSEGGRAVAAHTLPGQVNYVKGNQTLTVPRYSDIQLKDVAPGVGTRFYYDRGLPRYDIVVFPGTDPSRARVRYEGARNLRTGADGKLRYDTPLGTVEERDLLVYQDLPEGRTQIPAKRTINPDGTVGFRLGAYDRSKPVVIDPVVWATYLGGATNYDYAKDISADSDLEPVVAGYTFSSDFPTKVGSYAAPAADSGFITKLSPDGKTLRWSTMLAENQVINGVMVDKDDSIVLVGKGDVDWPSVIPGGGVGTDSGSVGIARISNDGGTIIMGRRFGGSNADEEATTVDIDAAGNLIVGGNSRSTDFPVTVGTVQAVRPNTTSALGFVAKVSANGTPAWATWLGCDGYSRVNDLAVTPQGSLVVLGGYRGAGMPQLPNNTSEGEYGFITRLTSDGTDQIWAGSVYSESLVFNVAVDLDSAGNATLVGYTNTAYDHIYYRKTGGAAEALAGTPLGGGDAFIARIDTTGNLDSSIIASGSGTEYAEDVVTEPDGRAYAVLYTESTDVPVTRGRQPDGNGDAWVMSVTSTMATIQSEVYGGTDYDEAYAGALVPGFAQLYLAGEVWSSDLPNTTGTVFPAYGQSGDAFVMRVAVGPKVIDYTGFTVNPKTIIGSPSVRVSATLGFTVPLPTPMVFNIGSNNSAAKPPASISVPAGAKSFTFSVATDGVFQPTTATLTAFNIDVGAISTKLTVNPPVIQKIEWVPPTALVGGRAFVGYVYLPTRAQSGGQAVPLKVVYASDSSPVPASVATVGSVTVSSGNMYAKFYLRSLPVTASTEVKVEGPNGVQSQAVTILPASPATLKLGTATVSGGLGTVRGLVTLDGAAPTGGLPITVTTDNPDAYVPPTSPVVVPAGAKSVVFYFRTKSVPSDTTMNVTVQANLNSASAPLLVLSPRLYSFTLSRTSIPRGNRVFGRVGITAPAPVGGLWVPVDMVTPIEGITAPTLYFVPAGTRLSAQYEILTSKTMPAPQTVTFKAAFGGVEKTRDLTINP